MWFCVGKGTQVWKASGDLYDGDWEAGMRHEFGTLSVRDEDSGEYVKKYSGGWKHDKRHVRELNNGTPLIQTQMGQVP